LSTLISTEIDGVERFRSLTLPIFEYAHSQGCSITGGFVYRGNKISSLNDYYIYGDFCSGNIRALFYDGEIVTKNVLLAQSNLSITSFGMGKSGNLYVLSRNGNIYSIVQN
jgi:hypothetical protein